MFCLQSILEFSIFTKVNWYIMTRPFTESGHILTQIPMFMPPQNLSPLSSSQNQIISKGEQYIIVKSELVYHSFVPSWWSFNSKVNKHTNFVLFLRFYSYFQIICHMLRYNINCFTDQIWIIIKGYPNISKNDHHFLITANCNNVGIWLFWKKIGRYVSFPYTL